MKPIIGITSAWSYETWGDCEKEKGYYYVGKPYVEAVYKAGGLPLIIHPYTKEEDLDELLESLDGILFSGGGNARKFTPENLPDMRTQQPERYEFENKLMGKAYELGKPILGICRGFQMIVEHFGGSLADEVISGHKQTAPSHEPWHLVSINKDSSLFKIIEKESWNVNSIHIQKVENMPKGFIVSAKTEDEVIEGIEAEDYPFLFGFQFHPELLREDRAALGVFDKFINTAKLKL